MSHISAGIKQECILMTLRTFSLRTWIKSSVSIVLLTLLWMDLLWFLLQGQNELATWMGQSCSMYHHPNKAIYFQIQIVPPIYIQLGTLGCIPTSLWRCLALHFNCGGSLDTQGLACCWWVTLGEMGPAILARSEDSSSQMQSFLWQLGLTHQ